MVVSTEEYERYLLLEEIEINLAISISFLISSAHILAMGKTLIYHTSKSHTPG
jgi:hypothetical protein